MKRFLRKLLKHLLYVIAIPVTYVIVSIVLSYITVNDSNAIKTNNTIFLNTNGVHLDIIIPTPLLEEKLSNNLNINTQKYISFGWGDENFYLNTPTWGDLTFKNAFSALFINSSSLVHVTKYQQKKGKWVEVNISDNQLNKLNVYITKSFKLDFNQEKIILKDKGYSFNDDFYKATGSYSCLKTCNTWVNSALKTSGIKSCYWTPFDFILLKKYKN